MILKKFILDLKIKNPTVFIGGSFFFTSQDKYQRFINGESDVDVIVICKNNNSLEISLRKIFNKNVVRKFLQKKYLILNYSYPYGIKRNVLHIKFMSYELFKSITSLKELSFKSFRREPLTKKKKATFFASNSTKLIHFPYTENKTENSYLLHYRFNPIQQQNFFLSDIHSLILFSVCVFDSIGACHMRAKLLKNIMKHLRKLNSLEDVMRPFQYFSEKGFINEYWQNIFREIFLNQKSIDLLYFQDLHRNKKG